MELECNTRFMLYRRPKHPFVSSIARATLLWCLFGAGFAATSRDCSAQASPLERETLAAIQGVRVEVVGITAAAEADGLFGDSVRGQVESMLSAAGIPTLSQSEWQQTIGNPGLYIKFQLLKPSDFFYIYHLSLEVRQVTMLARDTTKMVHARTWSGGETLGTLPPSRLVTLHDEVRTLVRHFVRDYLMWRRDDSGEREIGALNSQIHNDKLAA